MYHPLNCYLQVACDISICYFFKSNLLNIHIYTIYTFSFESIYILFRSEKVIAEAVGRN